MIYNNLDSKLRRDIRRLRNSIKLNNFLKKLDNFKYN